MVRAVGRAELRRGGLRWGAEVHDDSALRVDGAAVRLEVEELRGLQVVEVHHRRVLLPGRRRAVVGRDPLRSTPKAEPCHGIMMHAEEEDDED